MSSEHPHGRTAKGFALILGAVTLLPVQRRRVVREAPGELVPAAATG